MDYKIINELEKILDINETVIKHYNIAIETYLKNQNKDFEIKKISKIINDINNKHLKISKNYQNLIKYLKE